MRKLFALFEKKNFWTLGRKFLEPSCDGCLLFRIFFQVSKAKVFSNFLVRKDAELSESIFFRSCWVENCSYFLGRTFWNQKIRKKSTKVRKVLEPEKFKRIRHRKFEKEFELKGSNNFRSKKLEKPSSSEPKSSKNSAQKVFKKSINRVRKNFDQGSSKKFDPKSMSLPEAVLLPLRLLPFYSTYNYK